MEDDPKAARHAVRIEADLSIAAAGVGKVSNKLAPKSGTGGRPHRRSAPLGPVKAKDLGFIPGKQGPFHGNASAVVGQGTVLSGVGAELMQKQSEIERIPRRQRHVGSAARDPIFLCAQQKLFANERQKVRFTTAGLGQQRLRTANGP